jgi:hypothetical protein
VPIVPWRWISHSMQFSSTPGADRFVNADAHWFVNIVKSNRLGWLCIFCKLNNGAGF